MTLRIGRAITPCLGPPQSHAIMPLLTEGRIALVVPSTGAGAFGVTR